MRAALVDAIDENELMRGRVCELEAMMAAMQLQMERSEE